MTETRGAILHQLPQTICIHRVCKGMPSPSKLSAPNSTSSPLIQVFCTLANNSASTAVSRQRGTASTIYTVHILSINDK